MQLMTRTRILTAMMAMVSTAACGGPAAGGPAEAQFLHGAGGVNERVGGILLRDVSLDEPEDGLYEAGDVARLRVVFYNETPSPDRLVDVSTPSASEVRLLVDPNCDGVADRLGTIRLPVPSSEAPVSTDGPEPYYRVDLLLAEQVRSGESLEVTFTFAEAGTTTVQVPVELAGESNVDDDAECEPVL